MKRFSLVLFLALLATAARGEATLASTKAGILESLNANCAACNEEDLDALLDCMSEEMPQRELFIDTIQSEWQRVDTYSHIYKVEVLRNSTVPNANCQYPYATAWVTQTIVELENGRMSVFQQCQNGQCLNQDLARKMNIVAECETTRTLMLFKHEAGRWKLVAGLTDPQPVRTPAVKASRSSYGRK